MEGISDIKIVGIDEKRPPRVRKEPYIDLFFKLSHKAPPAWCADFNALISDQKSVGKINAVEGLYIEAWVRAMEDIPKLLVLLRKAVEECTSRYIANILQREQAGVEKNEQGEVGGEQGRLNKIIAELKYE